jgi:sister chromatid cohesion protein PDS5
LQSCIEEFGSISTNLLEILLTPLLPAQKADNSVLYIVVATVLHSTTELVEPTLTRILSGILVGSGNHFNGSLGELADDIFPLIFELHKVSPKLIINTFPSLTVQLRSEEEKCRFKVVQLLGKLYTSEGSTYIHDFPRDFKDFIEELNDASPLIRREMAEIISNLLPRNLEQHFVIGMCVMINQKLMKYFLSLFYRLINSEASRCS